MSWLVSPLNSVCDIQMGSAPSGSTYVDLGEGVPLIAGAADYGDITPNPKKATTEPTRLTKSGDIILCVRATIGDLNWADGEYCLGRGVAGLRAEKNKLDSKYLWYFLLSHNRELYKQANGSTFPQINREVIETIPIPLPPLATQQHIARVLEQADQLRKQAQQMECELNQLAQSLFLEMFGDPVRNPKGWEIIPLSGLADVQGGLQVTYRRDSLPVEVPYLRVANVFKDKIDLDEVKTIRVTEQELERTALQKGDMLVVEGHGNKDEIGRAAIWEGELDVCTHQNHLIRVRFDFEKIIPQFVSIYLNSSGGREQIRRLSKTTSGLNTISTNNVKSLELIVPDRETQQTYTDAYAAIQQQLSELESLKDTYEEIFESLMQRAFNGELTAPERKAA